MKRYLATIAAVFCIVALFWVGGFDFNTRGVMAVLFLEFSIITAIVAWDYFGDKE